VSASKLLLNAYLLDGFKLDSDGQHLLGLANRMRLFAPPNIIDEAEVVIRQLIEISLKPSVIEINSLTIDPGRFFDHASHGVVVETETGLQCRIKRLLSGGVAPLIQAQHIAEGSDADAIPQDRSRLCECTCRFSQPR
jgi:hypothetical protein